MSSEIGLLVLAWLGTYVLHSTLLLGGVLFLSRKGYLQAPRLAERIWRLAVVGGVLTATLQVGLVSEPILGTFSFQATAEMHGNRTPESTAEEHFAASYVPRPSLTLPAAAPSGTPATALAPGAYDRAPSPRAALAERPVEEREAAGTEQHAFPGAEGPQNARGTREARTSFGREPIERAHSRPELPVRDEVGGEAGFAATAPGTPAETLVTAALRRGDTVSWRSVVLATWALFGGLGILGFLFAWSRLAVRLSDRREIVAGPIREKLSELTSGAGLKRPVRLYASSTLASPITYGWLRRKICIPVRALTDLSPGQQASMLAHELAHAKRRDPVWFCFYTLAERVLFFQPLNRTARRELHDIAEMLCDDWAVRWTGGRLALASCLTEIAEWIVGHRHEHHPALPSPGMAGRPSRLGVRVERLLDDRRSPQPEPSHRWWSPVATTSLALVALAAPGVSSTPSAPEAARPSPASSGSMEAEPGASRSVPASEKVANETPPIPSADAPDERDTPGALPSILGIEGELMNAELHQLQELLALARAEIAQLGLDERYASTLQALERKIETLRRSRELLEEKLAELVSNPR